MVNLVNRGDVKNKVLLDPFCGVGTILQEAILLGYQNIIGTDINQKAIEAANQNIDWLEYQYKIQNVECKIFQADIRDLSKEILVKSVDNIVTEPYLGPLRRPNSKLEIQNLISDLSSLYINAFKEFKKVLKPNGYLVIILPIFLKSLRQDKGESPIILSKIILTSIKKMGWQVEMPLPKDIIENQVVKVTNRGSIIYSRPDQRVLREIFIFKLSI